MPIASETTRCNGSDAFGSVFGRLGRTGPVALEGRPGPRLEQGTGESGRIHLPRRRSIKLLFTIVYNTRCDNKQISVPVR